MARRGLTCLATVTALVMVGCGTLANRVTSPDKPTPLGAESPQLYGGVCVARKMAVQSQPDHNPVYRGMIFRSLGCFFGACELLIDAPLA